MCSNKICWSIQNYVFYYHETYQTEYNKWNISKISQCKITQKSKFQWPYCLAKNCSALSWFPPWNFRNNRNIIVNLSVIVENSVLNQRILFMCYSFWSLSRTFHMLLGYYPVRIIGSWVGYVAFSKQFFFKPGRY